MVERMLKVAALLRLNRMTSRDSSERECCDCDDLWTDLYCSELSLIKALSVRPFF